MRKIAYSIALCALVASFTLPMAAHAESSEKVKNPAFRVEGNITAMSGVEAPATLTILSGATTFTVEVSKDTTVVRKFNGSSDLSEFIVGDTVQVRGKLSDDAANTIVATSIKNTSIQRVGGTFKGSIVTLSCDQNTFTYKPDKRDQQTVKLSSSTKIIRGGIKVTCNDLKAKERAKVIGVWRPSTKTIDADRVVVNVRTIEGKIDSVTLTDGGLPATMIVRKDEEKTFTVNISSTTKIFRKHMKTATIEELLVGDKVVVRGITNEDKSINALVVRDLSVLVKYGDFKGKVKSIDADAKTFVLSIISGKKIVDITVTTSSTTKYKKEDHTKDFSYIEVGDKLKVLGEFTSSTKTLKADRIWWRD